MGHMIQERQRIEQAWQTMQLNGEDCEMSEANAEEAASKLRGYFGVEFEYRVVEKGEDGRR